MAWKYSAKEFIKVYRRFMEWEWYTDVNTKTLFLHCLLKANWKAGEWHGIHYEAGEFITSLPSIAEETGLTIRQARTSISRLETTGEVTCRMTDKTTGKKLSKCRIVTVNNWVKYQGSDRQNDRQNDRQLVNETTGKRQATCQASDSRYKKYKEHKNTHTSCVYIPTHEEITERCLQLNYNGVDVDKFIEYNNGKGWSLEWKTALDLWYKSEKGRSRNKNQFTNISQHDYDFDELERALNDE